MIKPAIATTALIALSFLCNCTSWIIVAHERPDSGLPAVPGVWTNVTPAGINLDPQAFGTDNFGVDHVVVDPARMSDLYVFTSHQGIWKSTDFGQTWFGPINTGTNGARLSGKLICGAIANRDATSPPTLWTCNRGTNDDGVWRSTDGGVSWTLYQTLPPTLAQRVNSYAVDPYDPNHLLAGIEQGFGIAESTDGGVTWADVSNGLSPAAISNCPFFIDTGDAAGTSRTWLSIAQAASGNGGTSQTEDRGVTWANVSRNEHPLGDAQIFQSPQGISMAGIYGVDGWGIYQSTDLGRTWTYPSMQPNGNESVVWGTPTKLYAMWGWANTNGVAPNLEIAAQPGAGQWVPTHTPSELNNGANAMAVLFDGTHYVFVGAMWNAGIWRYIEP